jgi:hypothetical protein
MWKCGSALADVGADLWGVFGRRLLGQSGDNTEIIALRDISPQIDDLGVKFRFRHFQDINGSLKLPDGFEPLEVQVVAQSKGKEALQAKRTFMWIKLLAS